MENYGDLCGVVKEFVTHFFFNVFSMESGGFSRMTLSERRPDYTPR